jgi:hypothetical protein
MEYGEKTGIGLSELKSILKAIRRRREFGFRELYVKDEGRKWGVYGSMSPGERITGVEKLGEGPEFESLREVEVPPRGGPPPNISETWRRAYERGIPDLSRFVNEPGQQLRIPLDYVSPADKHQRSNRQRMRQGVGPIFPSGDTIELHHEGQDFFGRLHEKGAAYHRDLHDDPEAHPFAGDPGYDSWRRCYGYYEGKLKTLAEIYRRHIRRKYLKNRAK